jgi:hypothetical protein
VSFHLDAAREPGDQPLGDSRSQRACSRHALVTYGRNDVRRSRIEHFIQQAFAQRHGATIKSFMPTLLALEGGADRICGVVGFRGAAAEPLFLEHYLHQPIEMVLSERAGVAITRDQIAEVGNLASLSCRAAVHLVAVLPRVLIESGHQWIAFTATNSVRGILEKFGARLIELATASRDCVERLGDDWGRYYDSDPRVMAGYLPHRVALASRGERS